ncbi:hypothetical protein Bca4012_075103 [Brassica carinata]
MWTQDAELAWDKLEEQVYTVEKRQEINLGKTIMLKDGRYGQWKVRMKLLARGINVDVWITVKTGWEDPTIFTAEGKKLKPKEPRQGVAREECISHGGEEHSDGCPDVDGAYLVGEKNISMYEDEDNASLVGENGIPSVKACGVVGYHVDARYAEMEKDKLRRNGENPLGVFLGRAEAVAEVLTTERQVWVD